MTTLTKTPGQLVAPGRDTPHVRARPLAGSLAALAVFVALAYALSWAWLTPPALAGDVIEKGTGWPTHFPALFGPMVAALVVTAWLSGKDGLTDLLERMGRWRMPLRWWLATVSPLLFLGPGLLVSAIVGDLPSWGDFGRYSGLTTLGIVSITALVVLGALGEETGWRGFALPLLQRRYSPLAAALLVTPIWALWHLPFFFTITTYRDFAPPAYIGFLLGLGCGSIVLTWLYNRTGGSILACAFWHGLFNMATATVAVSGIIAGVTSTLVIIQAILLLRLERRAHKHGGASVLGPRAATPSPIQIELAT